jgi:hypothetical protein
VLKESEGGRASRPAGILSALQRGWRARIYELICAKLEVSHALGFCTAFSAYLPNIPEGGRRHFADDCGLTDISRRGHSRQICDAALYHIMLDGIEGFHAALLRCEFYVCE